MALISLNNLERFFNNLKTYISNALNSKANTSHTHTSSDITDLPSGLTVDSTIDGTSSNAIANSAVSNALDEKSNTGHTHTKSQITDFPTIPSKTSDLTNDSNFITSTIKEGSISSTGWCLLYGDLLIQWGTDVFDKQGTVNFKKPFSEPPYVVLNYGDTFAYDSPCAVIGNSTTNTYFTARQYKSVGTWRCNWIAIGKKGY